MQAYVPREKHIDPNMTLRQFVDEYFWPKKSSLRESTLEGYRRDMRRILFVLGDLPLPEIRHEAVQFLIDQCPTKKAGKNARNTLSSVLSCARELEALEVNRASDRFRYPDVLPEVVPYQAKDAAVLDSFGSIREFLTAARLFDCGGTIERACLLGLCFGLRASEIFAVDWDDLDFDKRSLNVWKTYVRHKGDWALMPPKTEAAYRIVPIVGYALGRIQEIGTDGHGAWVRNSKGERAKRAQTEKLLRNWRERYGLPDVTLSSMRHSFATSCIDAGIPVSIVARWLGHSDPSWTARYYVRPKFGALLRAAKGVDRELGERGPQLRTSREAVEVVNRALGTALPLAS